MFGRTTKINMLKAGPILFVGLIVLIITWSNGKSVYMQLKQDADGHFLFR